MSHEPFGFRAIIAIAVVSFFPVDPAESEAAENASQPVRVGGIVLKWLRTDKETNIRRIEPLIRQAAEGGAEMVAGKSASPAPAGPR